MVFPSNMLRVVPDLGERIMTFNLGDTKIDCQKCLQDLFFIAMNLG